MGLFRRHARDRTSAEPDRPLGADVTELTKLGVSRMRDERWREAIEPLETAVAEGSEIAHLLLAQAYANLGNGDATRRHYEAVLATSPAAAADLVEQYRWIDAAGEVKSLGTSQEGEHTYETYACADVQMAQEFVSAREVDRPLYYVDVETPDGTWGVDIDGIYQGRLPDWKKDLDLVECDVGTLRVLSADSLKACARGLSDNFVVTVGCGRCGHEWIAAARYQDVTAARCPSCGAYNRVDSHNVAVAILGDDETDGSTAARTDEVFVYEVPDRHWSRLVEADQRAALTICAKFALKALLDEMDQMNQMEPRYRIPIADTRVEIDPENRTFTLGVTVPLELQMPLQDAARAVWTHLLDEVDRYGMDALLSTGREAYGPNG